VTEARHREELGDTLEGSYDNRFDIGDSAHRLNPAARVVTTPNPPVGRVESAFMCLLLRGHATMGNDENLSTIKTIIAGDHDE
jgi:hypothetical protein